MMRRLSCSVCSIRYPESPTHRPTVWRILRKSQTSQSYPLGREIEANHEQLKLMLSVRKAIELMNLRRDIKLMEETYPRSSFNDADLQIGCAI